MRFEFYFREETEKKENTLIISFFQDHTSLNALDGICVLEQANYTADCFKQLIGTMFPLPHNLIYSV